jgi:hypothetical protein
MIHFIKPLKHAEKSSLLWAFFMLHCKRRHLHVCFCRVRLITPKLYQIAFKNPVRTSKRTPHFTITKINWLTLFKFNPLKPKTV